MPLAGECWPSLFLSFSLNPPIFSAFGLKPPISLHFYLNSPKPKKITTFKIFFVCLPPPNKSKKIYLSPQLAKQLTKIRCPPKKLVENWLTPPPNLMKNVKTSPYPVKICQHPPPPPSSSSCSSFTSSSTSSPTPKSMDLVYCTPKNWWIWSTPHPNLLKQSKPPQKHIPPPSGSF